MRERVEYFYQKGFIYWYKDKWAKGLFLDLKLPKLFKEFCKERQV